MLGSVKFRQFGKHGFEVSEIGVGAWAMGGGWGPQAEEDSFGSMNAALDAGVNFVDTAAVYGMGHGERVVAKALTARGGEKPFVATKTPPKLPGTWPPSIYEDPEERYSEAYLRESLAERMENLQTDKIDLLQLHTWTRAWNRDPKPYKHLRKLQSEGKIGLIGVSTPEHDQNSVNDLMRGGWVDSVQVIYNIFEQEPAAELLDIAGETGTGVIVRVALDEGSLTGRFTPETTFPEGDFRRGYFAGDRLGRAVARAEKVKVELEGSGYTMVQAALKFVLAHPAVSTVIVGMRNQDQALANCAVSDLPDLPAELLSRLKSHYWRRGMWNGGK